MNLYIKHAKNFAEILLHFLFPVNCPVCGRPAEIICPDCAKKLFAEEIISKKIENLEIFSASWYHTEINKLISLFKYSEVRAFCKPLGREMAKFFPKPEADYLVPVPLHLKSKRNYNQALELAKGMSEIWNIKIFNGVEWAYAMPNRAGLKAEERMKLKSNAFIIPKKIKALRVAIIDDVCTTGMTLLRFSQACEHKGAYVVGAYTLATVSA
ncbi:MAG: ComF family protein [Synergistaceae bacterium]|nr:ComF family protein [Synergistaceae bacterium]